MFASTQDLEFVQGQSRDVPDRELGPNIDKQDINNSIIMKCSVSAENISGVT